MKTRTNQPVVKSSASAEVNYLDRVITRLKCYEPNSQAIELTGEDLCRNTLYVGTVGSGKTTCMNPLLRDILRFQADQPEAKIGLLVIDSKVDDTVQKIQAWARDAGRADDVQILSPTGEFYYDFLADLKDFNQLEIIVEKIMASFAWNNAGENEYWQHGRKPLLKAALTICLVHCLSNEIDPSHALVMGFIQNWLTNAGAASLETKLFIHAFQAQAAKVRSLLQPGEQAIIDETLSTIRMWEDLDPKTKSNWSSVILNCLSPFSDMAAQAYFINQNRQRAHLADIVEQGKIVIVSVNAGRIPDWPSF